MLPKKLALIDDDIEYTEYLSQHLREQGIEVDVFADSNDLLAHTDAYGFDFYVVDLSETDLVLLETFLEAGGEVVSRETLRQRLGREVDDSSADGLNAMIYRLRRRIERATPTIVPLQSKSRVGYVFRASLKPL